MPPVKKTDLEKLAWAWVESVSPEEIGSIHLESAYRIGLKNCKNCKRNCSNNPRCLTGLGEEKYLKSQPAEVAPLESSLSELRDPTQYVGLKNLGATCYVNSLIQVWFHNEDMRKIIYKWKITEDPEERESLERSRDTGQTFQPVTVVGQLQYIFAMMQFGNKRLLDPTSLAIALSLDTGTQQDAQEFSKLLLAHIEGKLQQNRELKSMLERLTQGTYIYVNRCEKCKTEYETPTTFYELDLQLATTLKEAIDNYLSEEVLNGTNKYHCQHCNDKEDAKRFIRLDTLPDTLNFQLLRFVFHRESAQKKKLTSSIQFPEELDMSEYLGYPQQSHLYNLVAVLSHKGPSAHSGHYIVNICNTSGEWYQFSDDKVERMQNKRIEDGINDSGKPVKRGRILKGCLISNSAYMLVYKRKPADSKAKRAGKISKHSKEDLNHVVATSSALQHVKEIKTKRDIIPDPVENSKRKESSDLDESPFSPVKKLKANENHSDDDSGEELNERKNDEKNSDCLISRAVKRIDLEDVTAMEVCNEGSVHEFKGHELNTIKKSTITTLKDQKNSSDKLKNNWVKNYKLLNGDAHRAMSCREREHYESLEFDTWGVSETLRELVRQENVEYELGLLAIQEEKQKEIKNQNIKRQEVIDFYTIVNNTTESSEYYWIPTSWLSKWLSDHSGYPDTISSIDNTILLCTHQRLDPSKVNRAKSIPKEAASLIFFKYNGAPLLDQNSLCESCVKKRCKMLRFKLNLERDHKEVTEIMKNEKDVTRHEFIVGAASWRNWRRLALEQLEDSNQEQHEFDQLVENNKGDNSKETEESEETDKILHFNEDLLCEHGGLRAPDASRRAIPAAAWTILKQYFPSASEYPINTPSCAICEEKVENEQRAKKDDKIRAKAQKEALSDLYYMKNRPEIQKFPEKMYLLVANRFLTSWRLFIRNSKNPPSDINNSYLLCEEHKGFLYTPSATCDLYTVVTADEWVKLEEFYSVDHVIQIISGKDNNLSTIPQPCDACIEVRLEKERIESLTYDKASIYIISADEGEESESTIKSSRPSRSRRKGKHSHELKVSSQDTLKQLKVMTMQLCGVPPYDQHLMLGDHELKDPDQNLGSLGVYPGATLKLKIDTPQDGDVNTESDSVGPESSSPEKGFKGTELVSN